MNIPPLVIANPFESVTLWVVFTMVMAATVTAIIMYFRKGRDSLDVKALSGFIILVSVCVVFFLVTGVGYDIHRTVQTTDYTENVVTPTLESEYSILPTGDSSLNRPFEAVVDGQIVEVRLIKIDDKYTPFVNKVQVPKKP